MSKQFNPKVSIVIPVYNGSNYLKEAIDSALVQTYKNIEIVVINDGSNDNGKTERICRSYGKKIRYFKKENGGVSSALNYGIKKMEGEYFSWLSHDDIYYPEKVEKQIKCLSNIPKKDNIILFANYELIDQYSETLNKVRQDHDILVQKPEYALLRGRVNGITLLIPIKAFKEHGLFSETLKCTQDYDMWRRMMKTYNFVHMNDIFTKTRIHPQQDSNKHPNVTTEGDPLWIDMMESLSKKDKQRLEDSEYNFYREMLLFLQINSPYIGAIDFANKRMEEIYDTNKYKVRNIKVTVIIPFFNRIQPLLRAVESVQNQSHENWEMLLINDGSTEDLIRLKKHIKDDKRIRIITLEKNCGPAKARNTGIDQATGEYIVFLDSDDEFVPEKIKEQLTYMYLTKYDVSHTSYIKSGKSSKESIHVGKLTGTVIPEIIKSCEIATPTVMIRTKYLKSSKIQVKEDFRIGEDTCFWLELLRDTKLLGIDELLTIIHVNERTASSNAEKHLEGLTNVLGFILSDVEYRRYHKKISYLCNRYIQISEEVTRKEELEDEQEVGNTFLRKLRKIIYLFKYQGVGLTIVKVIRKYGRLLKDKIIGKWSEGY